MCFMIIKKILNFSYLVTLVGGVGIGYEGNRGWQIPLPVTVEL